MFSLAPFSALPVVAAAMTASVPMVSNSDVAAMTDRSKVATSPRKAPSISCRDTVHLVRKEAGLPDLSPKQANTPDAMFIAAVDRRIDGCSVLVMAADPDDIRPLPEIGEFVPKLLPAN